MNNEVWKDIENYEGLYQISNLGRIKSLKRIVNNGLYSERTTQEKILNPQIRNTYYVINLHKDGKSRSFQVHRLVASAFIQNQYNYKIVNHKDFNRLNNIVENLEWCTQKQNVNHSKINYLKLKNNKLSKDTNEKYIHIKYNHGKKRYRVHIKQLNKEKIFKNLEDAIKYRNDLLPMLELYYKEIKSTNYLK